MTLYVDDKPAVAMDRADVAAWQDSIDRIISEAKKNSRTEIPISELIEDPCLLPTPNENQKDIRFICNNSGKET